MLQIEQMQLQQHYRNQHTHIQKEAVSDAASKWSDASILVRIVFSSHITLISR